MIKKKIQESGQSTIEFIFTFAFGVGIILLVFNAALNYATGYLVHYATFMASRTYLTADFYTGTVSSPQVSMSGTTELAQETFGKYMLDIFNVSQSNFKVNPPGNSAAEYLTTGAVTSFDLRIDMIGKITGQTMLELSSESYLGKEPTRAQCANRVCYGITGRTDCDNSMDITLYDDGC